MDSEYIRKLKNGCAFTPCYVEDKGKVTRICYKDGGYDYVEYSIKKVINDYCAINLRCIKSIKKLCKTITGRKTLMPLYVMDDTTLIPIKTMKPVIKGDNCIGYINIKYVCNVDFLNNTFVLSNGCIIHYLENKETIKRRIGDCTIINKKILSM